ncbi:hypothetical protein GGQ69_001000 [Micrococcus sp. TA1]|nr:hypothetical protein [Micrococcus sp. TA1]
MKGMLLREDRRPAVESEALILLPDAVEEVEDVVSQPERCLVSMYAEPQRAARVWRERRTRHPYGSEGLLRLSYCGGELLSPG